MKNAFMNRVNGTLLGISHFMAKIPDFSAANPKKLILSLIALSLFFLAGIPKIKLDMSMEAFFRTDDPSLNSYNVFHYLFGGDQFLMLMFQPKDGDIFSEQSLKALRDIEKDINDARIQPDSHLSRITRVRTIFSADYLEATDEALISRKFVGADGIPASKEESEAIRQLALKQKDFAGSMFSKDSKLGIMMIQTDYGSRLKVEPVAESQNENASNADKSVAFDLDTDSSFDFSFEDEKTVPSGLALNPDELPKYETPDMMEYSWFMEEFNQILDKHNWKLGLEAEDANMGYLAVGNPWMMDFFNRVVMTEMGLYSVTSMVLILIVLYFVVGSLPGMIWPTLIVGTGIIWTLGIIGWSGIAVNMLINIVVFLILTVGIAASIHILSGYKQFRTDGLEHPEAMTKTMRKTGLPIFLAALTTIAGMLSMIIVPIAPIQAFAGFAAVSVVVTFILTIFFLPVGMHYWAPNVTDKSGALKMHASDRVLQSMLTRIYHWGNDYPRTIVILFIMVAMWALAGLPKVFIDTNISTMIKEGAGLREALTAIDENFGGTSTAEVLIDSGRADGIKDPGFLKAIEEFEQKVLQGRPDLVSKVDSVTKLAKQAYQNMSDGSEANYIIPDRADVLSQTLFSFESADPSTRKLFVDDEWQVARVTLQVETRGSSEYEEFDAQVKQWLEEAMAPVKAQNPDLKTSVTGAIPLMMTMTSFISEAQLRSYVLVICVIASLLLLIFGSLKFGAMALIPNVFPIVMIMGVTGWAGIPLDSDTLLVMPLAIGIAVDDSIHFLTHYRTELLNGKKSKEAIRLSLRHVGQAMIYTSVVLSLGFLVFMMSVHQGLTNFGILSAIAMFSALLADILLLPAMIYIFKPFDDERKNTSTDSPQGATA